MVKRVQSDAGFSLVETLIATFIFALVSAMAVALISSYQTSRSSLKSADEKLSALEIARSIIRDDYFAAIIRPVRDQFGTQLPPFEAGDHMLDGVRQRLVRGSDAGAKLNGAISEIKRVEYLVEGGTLIRRTYNRSDIVQDATPTDQLLLANVEDLEIRYNAQGLWTEEWGTTRGLNDLPRLAEMVIEFAGGKQTRMTFLIGRPA